MSVHRIRSGRPTVTVVTGGGGGGTDSNGSVNYADPFGLRDGYALKTNQADDFGLADGYGLKTNQADDFGLRDGFRITGLGTPQLLTQSTVALASATNNIPVPKPAGVQVGDLLLAFVAGSNLVASGSPAFSAPAGWTTALGTSGVVFNGTVAGIGAGCYWRIADGSEPSTVTFDGISGTQGVGQMFRLSGTSTTAPINAFNTATLAATALVTDPVSPAVTPTSVNCLIFRFLAHYHVALSNTHTPPASHVERTDFESNVLAAILSGTVDTIVKATTGTTGTATHDCSETVATDAVMITVAIAPGPIDISG